MKKLKEILASPYFIAFLFVFKMMVYYSLIKVNYMETVFILLSLIVWSTIFVCFGRSGLKRKRLIFLTVYFLFSLLMFSDTMYYNYYNQTVSIKQLWQAKSVAAVPASFFATLIPASFLLFVDIPFAYISFKKYATKENFQKWLPWRKYKYILYVLTALVITVIANPFHSAAFERVNNTEFFTNHVNDICDTISENLSKGEMEQEQILEVLKEDTPKADATMYKGIGNGKNLVVIQMEAFQNFAIGATYEGQELTPNINQLLKGDSLYYNNYFSNIGKGNTADAEFSSLNSLYPVIDGECYRLYPDNTYNGLPWLMRDNGYYAFAIHGFKGEFWNRETIYPKEGFQDYISMEDLNQDEIIGLGVSDKSMFKQLIPVLKNQTKPFYAFAITLTGHHPFQIDDKYKSITLSQEDTDTKFGDYLETIRYTDEAIGQFINDLKAEGLYDNTVIALYGDHHGMNCGMEEVKDRVSAFIGRTYDYDEMLNVPLIIHVPGSNLDKTISTTGGQIDFMPTIANIMGLDYDNTFVMGQDLTNAKEGFVAFTSYLFEGSFANNDIIFQISREGIFEGSRAWKIGTNEQVDAAKYREEYDKALLLKKTSKEIMEQNLIANYITH